MSQQTEVKKICVECGGEFVEKQESIHNVCEHCIGKNED